VTHICTSAAAAEPDSRVDGATLVITRPGALPSVTIPVFGGRHPDLAQVDDYLRAAADFFAVPMGAPADTAAVISDVIASLGPAASPVALTVTVADGAPLILTSAPVCPWRPDSVVLTAADSVPHAHRATDPWWQRMAARTTSRGELDQRERWLNAHGWADALSDGQPLLGALVFQVADGYCGLENPEPVSLLDQLMQSGVFPSVPRVPGPPKVFEQVWWVSPRYETHPVREIDGVSVSGDSPVVAPWVR
jgi:hypothetical protein